MYTCNSKLENHENAPPTTDKLMMAKEERYVEMPSQSEFERQLAAWNTTQQNYPRNACVPQLVAQQAATTPNAVALVSDEQILTYGELNRRSNQLAHRLQALGIGSNALVGLCVERSFEMVVGLLGILKAGGAYVPLDPTYPNERLSFMLEDAQAPVLVTQKNLAARFPTRAVHVVCFDADAAILAQQSKTELFPLATINDLAYMIYTSGSTGRPKGVQITHNSLLNLMFWHQRAFEVTSSDRATQIASPAFDATGWELWPYLTIGASVYLIDEHRRISPPLLRDWLVNKGITITFLPTTLAENMMALEWPSRVPLRYMLTGADKLRHYPPPTLPFALINNYGPTEAPVVATSGCVLPTTNLSSPPSIGRPIANTQIYILDEYLRQVPIGEQGELYIGGVGLAKGYFNRPDLTAERFISHPFSDEPGARLYKTGDVARFLPDGQIAFLGRNDQQIKIRGYRIEPDEIVSVLNRHTSIQTSLVIAREDIPGDKRLIAYVVLVPDSHITVSSLRDTLKKSLPDYMIPTAYVVLEMLPLTPNGKVDRIGLPIPDTLNTLQDEIATVPGTPLEKRLTEIVASLLNIEQVGLDDNFFMLGGHSLLGTQMITRVAETFGVDLPLRALFEAPTVRLLATTVERRIVAIVETMSDEEALRLLQ